MKRALLTLLLLAAISLISSAKISRFRCTSARSWEKGIETIPDLKSSNQIMTLNFDEKRIKVIGGEEFDILFTALDITEQKRDGASYSTNYSGAGIDQRGDKVNLEFSVVYDPGYKIGYIMIIAYRNYIYQYLMEELN